MKSAERVTLWSWNSWLGKAVIFLGTLCCGSFYPVVISWSKQGQDTYPFMFPTALLMVKFFMFIFYVINVYLERPREVRYSQVQIQEDDPKTPAPEPDFWEKVKLSLWAMPNILLTLVCDVMTFQAMRYLSVASYALVIQTTTLWIVVAQYLFLNKTISCPQSLSVTLVTLAVVGFQFIDLDHRAEESAVDDAGSAAWDPSVVFGVGLVLFRGLLKACNMVYCEWFLQHGLQQLSFYEKQTAISFWFVLSTFGLVLNTNGHELLFEGRGFFDGYGLSTWAYICLAASLGIWYYMLVKYLDALMCGINSMCCLPCTVMLDMALFGTDLSFPQLIFAGIIMFGSFQYNLLKGYVAK